MQAINSRDHRFTGSGVISQYRNLDQNSSLPADVNSPSPREALGEGELTSAGRLPKLLLKSNLYFFPYFLGSLQVVLVEQIRGEKLLTNSKKATKADNLMMNINKYFKHCWFSGLYNHVVLYFLHFGAFV